jgi:preprotein translocase subunit SecA
LPTDTHQPYSWESLYRMADASNLSRFEARARDAFTFAAPAAQLAPEELSEQTVTFRRRLASGASFADVIPEVLATVREAVRRAVGTLPSEAQLAAGLAVHAGWVVEIEGDEQTLTAILAAYVHSLTGQGVHLVTLDDELARRGARHAMAVLGLLGQRVGVVHAGSPRSERASAYAADVTYASYRQFADDYLLDSLALPPDKPVQRGWYAAVLEEVDSILLDKAGDRRASIGEVEPDANRYRELAGLATSLRDGQDYSVDAATGEITLTEPGAAAAEQSLGLEGLMRPEHADVAGSLADAIRARAWYRKGQDYAVIDGAVALVADRPGRLSKTTRFDRGVRQAIEAKEGLNISVEVPILARISVPGYFRMYRNLAGVTASAMGAAAEFSHNFGLEVLHASAGPPTRRVDHNDLLYGTQRAKLDDLARGVTLRHGTGQPVVIGAPDAEVGQRISRRLEDEGITHAVIKPGMQASLAAVMAGAGRQGAVTVICGSAGRGYQIRLGGGLAGDAAERENVIKAGGLAVIGGERSQSRRADQWLRGLAGQGGEPGECRFLIAMDDAFMTRPHGGGLFGALRRRHSPARGVPLTGPVQRIVEERLLDAEARATQERRTLVEYERIGDDQFERIYRKRRAILETENPREYTYAMIEAAIEASVLANPDARPLHEALAALYPVSLSVAELTAVGGGRLPRPELMAQVKADAHAAYQRREQELGSAVLREFEKKLMLGVIGREWREHLADLDRLREMAAADDNPLDTYDRLASERYTEFLRRIRERIVSNFFFLQFPH